MKAWVENSSYVYDTSPPGPHPDDGDARSSAIILGIMLFLLSVIAIVGNIATIFAFRENRELRHKTSNLLILSLSCSDLLIGATGLPFAAIGLSLGSWPLTKPVCIIGAFMSVLGVSGGFYTLTAINVDRWLLVSRDYSGYLRIQSLRNIKLQILGAWCAAGLISACETLVWVTGGASEVENTIDYTQECRSPVRTDIRFGLIIGILLFVIPFTVMIVCSLRFVVLLRRRLRKPKPKISTSSGGVPTSLQPNDKEDKRSITKTTEPSATSPGNDPVTTSDGLASDTVTTSEVSPRQNPNVTATPAPRFDKPIEKKRFFFAFRENSRTSANSMKMKNRYIKPAVRLAMLMSVFAFCSLPYPIFILLVDTKCSDCYLALAARNHLSNLLLANSALNPFLYAIMHRKIRQYHARKFRSIFCAHNRNVGI